VALAAVVLLVSLAVVGLARGQFDHPWEYIGICVLAVIGLIRLPKTIPLILGRRTITLGTFMLVAETVPFASTRVELPCRAIERIDVARVRSPRTRSVYAYEVRARVAGSELVLVEAEDTAMADFIKTWLDGRLALDGTDRSDSA
jgi:hypothetical protein